MLLSGHQPPYLPGLQFFNKVALSDACMLVPHCKFEPGSWHNRNRIRGANGEVWLSVPVFKETDQSIADAKIDGQYWVRKHLKSIEHAYRKRPFFDEYFPLLADAIGFGCEGLADLNTGLISMILAFLEIETPILISTDYNIAGHKTGMLFDMCDKVGADSYLSNEGARDYVDEEYLKTRGVIHKWQVFEHPVYDQGAPFVPNLSIVDLLFNCGPESGRIIRGAGHVG